MDGGNPNQPFGKIGAGTSSHQIPQYQSPTRPRLHFLEMLDLSRLSKLMNDPVHHDPTWPPFPIKPSEIPKFERKTGKDPGDHVTIFHLWCSSNSLNGDSIWLRLFQRNLTSVAVKWYN